MNRRKHLLHYFSVTLERYFRFLIQVELGLESCLYQLIEDYLLFVISKHGQTVQGTMACVKPACYYSLAAAAQG